MHAVIKIIFYIDHIKNTDNGLAAILVMQISKCNVISGYEHVAPLGHIILIPGATSGAGTAYSSEHLSSLTVFIRDSVIRSFVLCIMFVDRCLSCCPFSFSHCVVCPSICGF